MNIIEKLKEINIIRDNDKLSTAYRVIINNPKHADILEYVLTTTSFLEVDADLNERMYCILNGLTSRPLCKHCHIKQPIFLSATKGYNIFCGHSCGVSGGDNTKHSERHTIGKIERITAIHDMGYTILTHNPELLGVTECIEVIHPKCAHQFSTRINKIIKMGSEWCLTCSKKGRAKNFNKLHVDKIIEKRPLCNETNVVEQLKDIGVIRPNGTLNSNVKLLLTNPKNKDILEYILNATPFLEDTVTNNERIYCIVNGITSRPICKECNTKYPKFLKFTIGYNRFCSNKCSSNNKNTIEKKNLHNNTGLERLEKLKKLGYDILSEDAHTIPRKGKITVRNPDCGHDFEAIVGNLIIDYMRCPTCNAGRKREALQGFNDDRHDIFMETATEWQAYRQSVHIASRKTYREFKDIINPDNLPRMKAGQTDGYQLDHIVPIRYCFDHNIPIEICSHEENLQMLSWEENITSRDYLKEDIPEIFEDYIDTTKTGIKEEMMRYML